MNIYAIADLHLSGNPPAKPMTVFGQHWSGHWNKLKTDWQTKIKPDDIIIIAGDISWALKLEEALPDLNELIALPGKKLLVKGNHDYWWQTAAKMTKAVNSQLFFLHNNFYSAGPVAICGTRGWLSPDDPFFKPKEDLPTYRRELLRLENSLKKAKDAGCSTLIAALHYPPTYHKDAPSSFMDILIKYNVTTCIYGHLHGESQKAAVEGNIKGVTLRLVACDAVDFQLVRIM